MADILALPVINLTLSGARGPRGLASGPLGAGSVGSEEIMNSAEDRQLIVEKLGLPEIFVDLYPTVADAYAVALAAGGGTLRFGIGRYDHPWANPDDRIAQANIRLVGAGRPAVAADRHRMEDGTGTILNGPLYFWADNFAIESLGVDSGGDICAANHGGAAQNGLASFKPGQVAWNEITSPNKNRLTVRNVSALCQSPGAAIHAMLLEAYDHADVSDVEVTYGLHGFVGKLRFSNIRGVRAYGNSGAGAGQGEGFLLKGNSYAPLGQVNASGIVVEGGAYPNDNGIGIQVLAEAVPGAGGVTISGYKVYSKAVGVDLSGANLADVSMPGGLIETCATGARYGAGIKRCAIDAIINNAALPVDASSSDDLSNSYDGKVTNASGDTAIAVLTGKLTIGGPWIENVVSGDRICVRVSATGRARFGNILPKTGTFLSALNAPPALSNGWTALPGDGTAGNSPAPWAMVPKSGGFVFSGVLSPGSSDSFCTLPAWLTPSRDQYFSARVISGATEETRRGMFRSDGVIRLIGRPTDPGSLVFMDGIVLPDTFLPV